ncbi:motile sperm domain-containing protein 1-like [Neocloeon triangulifer]|uniref:motile sperm domain-containing protein 1-like n=1 Tax=Neocloeon triangulifer TaxID=2078957 RepID=UPI00286F519D|nr:motile sperm domain-containing protein 1-like [Neocloeon triangulifer]XP_059472823.1 motile sperm domain-containing protein 1-like [Neocloeon triangulifer]
MQPNVGLDGKIPVFVFPNSISFYLEDQRTHKQVLTLYNPYEFAIKFHVLCTAPKKYSVVDTSGSVAPKCCVDLVVRHKQPTITNCHLQDKLRIQVQEVGNKQVIGKRDVPACLFPGKPDLDDGKQDAEQFEQLTGNLPIQGSQLIARPVRQQLPGGTNYIAVAAAIACILALMMPTEGDKQSKLPLYLHLSVHMKLVFAYVLGLVTMVILRPS